VVTITVTCDLWAPSSGDHLFTCGAIYLPPHLETLLVFVCIEFKASACRTDNFQRSASMVRVEKGLLK